ncbi:MAG: hypothetical protein U0587_19845 [Candidatus Binatia bacterium]
MGIGGNMLFVACRNCGLLHPAVCATAHPSDEATTESLVAFGQFIGEHQAHQLAWFRRHGAEAASDHPLWDPMAAITFEATDGQQTYVVVSCRTSIDEPRTYRFAPGALHLASTAVLIDDHDLRRGLDRTFQPHVLRLTTLDRFVSLVHEVISHVRPDELSVAFDDAEDPAVSIAPMPDETYQELVDRCAEIFEPSEFGTVAKFLEDNREADGLLALRVRREFVVAHT